MSAYSSSVQLWSLCRRSTGRSLLVLLPAAVLVAGCGSSQPGAAPAPSTAATSSPSSAPVDRSKLSAVSGQLRTLSGDQAFMAAGTKLRDDQRSSSATAATVRNAHTAIIRALQIQPQNCSRIQSAVSAATPIASSGENAAGLLRTDSTALTTAAARLRPQLASTMRSIDLQLLQASSSSAGSGVVQELTTDKNAAQAILVNLNGAEASAKTANGKATSLTAGVGRLRALQKKVPKACR